MDDEQAKPSDPSPADPFSSEQMAESEQTAASNQSASPWDDLARTLGAEPSPDALARPHRESAPPHQEPSLSIEHPACESTDPSESATGQSGAAQPGNWAELASSLGLTVEDADKPAIPAPAGDTGTGDTGTGDTGTGDTGTGDTGTGPNSHPIPDAPEEKGSREAWEDRASLHQEEPSQSTFAEELDPPVDDREKSASPIRKGLSGDVARNVFDALFLSGTAAAEALGDMLPFGRSDIRDSEEKSDDPQATSEPTVSNQDEPNQEIRARDGTEKVTSGHRRGRGRRGRGRRRRSQGDGLNVAKEDAASKDSSRSESDPLEPELASAEFSDSESDSMDGLFVEQIETDMEWQNEGLSDVSSDEHEPSSTDKFNETGSDGTGTDKTKTEETHKSSTRRRRPRRRKGRGRDIATRETDDSTTAEDREQSAVAGSGGVGTGHETNDSTSAWGGDDWEQAASPDDPNRQESPDSSDTAEQDIREHAGRSEEEEEEEISDGRGSPTKRPSHRNIPTWSEAMSEIVDSNIEARKKSPAPSGRSSSSRNRGRGGRRRKKT